MTTFTGRAVPGAGRIRCQLPELSRDGRKRLAWFGYYEESGRNGRRTCRHFGISPQTFYRWLRRFDRQDLSSLESRSSRPRRLRSPTWSGEAEKRVLELRRQYPRWGKAKLRVLLLREGVRLSVSMVGRILGRLKRRHVLVDPPRARQRRGPAQPRRWAVRKPQEYRVEEPGDLVQLDTDDLRPTPGVVLKQFTARDFISRYDVLGVATRASATAASLFLDQLQERMPFPIRAIQVDGGSEFKAQFEQLCEARRISLFVLPPRSPKLNGRVERANRTHEEEFHEVQPNLPWTVSALTPLLRNWETIYNNVRPHQALGYLTPAEYVERWRAGMLRKEQVSPRY